ncbi:toxin-activating lysine-acyltransferase [bacterium]|nr:toxin-activating lysine-acyltransferase [bacterium]
MGKNPATNAGELATLEAATALRAQGASDILFFGGSWGQLPFSRTQDWKSGEQLWVVEIIAPFGGAELMVQDLKQKVFPTREMRFLATTAAGKEVRRV